MSAFVCIVDCEAADETVTGVLGDLAGEHVFELEAPARDQAEREALDRFFASYPALERLGDRVDVTVTTRRKKIVAAGTVGAELAEPRRGRAQRRPEADDPVDTDDDDDSADHGPTDAVEGENFS